MPTINIAEPSVKSLLIQMFFNGQAISTGTGFIANTQKGPVLLTNRHNLTGRHQETNKPLSPTSGIPNQIKIIHNRTNGLGNWIIKDEILYDKNDRPLWIEHANLKGQMDCVALPLTQLEEVQFYPYDLNNPGPDIAIGPADNISVVGFPFGIQTGGSLAIWATGFLASEPNLETPVFLIDCRSRPGQSGSPVIAYRNGGAVAMQSGGSAMFGCPVYKFLGIYSGRINSESDLGIVWKTSAIKELLDSII